MNPPGGSSEGCTITNPRPLNDRVTRSPVLRPISVPRLNESLLLIAVCRLDDQATAACGSA